MAEPNDSQTRSGRIIIASLVASTLALALYVVHRIDTAPRTDDAYAYADIVNVTPEVNGRIVELCVTENQAVRKGDVLFRLDPRPFQHTLKKAQASLVALDQEIMLAQRAVNAQKLAAEAAASGIEKARALAGQAAGTRGRMEPLLSEGFVAPEQLDQARTAEHAALVQLETARLESQRASAAVSGVEALVAKENVIKAEISMAELNLEFATVKAPCDGRVTNLKITAGQFASAGHPVFTLISTGDWFVVANFRETELKHIRPGRMANVYLLNDPGRSYRGEVESIGYGVFPDDGGSDAGGLPRVPRSINWVRVNQRFPVRIRIQDSNLSEFRMGASAVATLTGSENRVR